MGPGANLSRKGGQEALDRLKQPPPPGIVLDLNDAANGWEFHSDYRLTHRSLIFERSFGRAGYYRLALTTSWRNQSTPLARSHADNCFSSSPL
jgi:hypothetical protein